MTPDRRAPRRASQSLGTCRSLPNTRNVTGAPVFSKSQTCSASTENLAGGRRRPWTRVKYLRQEVEDAFLKLGLHLRRRANDPGAQ